MNFTKRSSGRRAVECAQGRRGPRYANSCNQVSVESDLGSLVGSLLFQMVGKYVPPPVR